MAIGLKYSQHISVSNCNLSSIITKLLKGRDSLLASEQYCKTYGNPLQKNQTLHTKMAGLLKKPFKLALIQLASGRLRQCFC